MGEVYRAKDTKLGREVAIKVLQPEMQGDKEVRQRFLREAKLAAALDHPFVCHVHETGETEGIAFIVMELVSGRTLQQDLVERSLDLAEALHIACEVAEALAEAHRLRIVHRDLKPANVMVTERGHVKVLDFGLAKHVLPELDP